MPPSLETFRNEKMPLSSILLSLSLCALWGGAVPAIKLSLQGMPPLAVAAWRFLIGLACLMIFCFVTRTSWRLPRRFHKTLISFSLLFVLQVALLNLGIERTSSSHSVVVFHTFPLFVALLAHFFIPNDRLNRWKISGLILAFFGICVVFLAPSGRWAAGEIVFGNLLVLAGGFLLGILQVYLKFLVRDLSAAQITVWEMIYGVPLFFFLSLSLESSAAYHLTSAVIGAILYQGVVVAGFCFLIWVHLMKRYAASKLNSFQFSTPLFGVILSWLILEERVSPTLVVGAAFVAGGIYLVSAFHHRSPTIDFSKRSQEPEMIDFPERLDQKEMVTMLGELRRINLWLGGTTACVRALRPLIKEIADREGKTRPIRIVDWGSGSADIPTALVEWARGEGYALHVTAIDSNFLACKVARKQTSQFSEITVTQGDVRNLPVRRSGCDLALCSAFLHHFSDEQIVGIVTHLRATAREAVVISDLQRHVLAYWGIRFLTLLFSRSRAVRSDGPLSVLKGFWRREVLALLNQAGVSDAALKWRWAFRYVTVIRATE